MPCSPLRRASSGVALLCAAALIHVPASVHAQGHVTLELGGSQIGPPLGVEGDVARYVVGGVRASGYARGGSGGFASVLFGQTLDEAAGGSFLSATVEGSLVRRWVGGWSMGLDARVLGWGTRAPYRYEAIAVEGGPSLRYGTDRFAARLTGLGGVGTSRFELARRPQGLRFVFEDDLWRYGGTGEITLGPLASNLSALGGWHRTPAGDYASVGGRLSFAGRWGVVEIRIERWDTPSSLETTGGVAFVLPIGSAWSARGFAGRSEPDPLTLAQPGSEAGGVIIGRTLWASDPGTDPARGLHRVVGVGEASSSVHLSVEADAASVAVLGDFTLWEPVAMSPDEGRWSVVLTVPVGIHHFGFLVDDEWYVPDDAPDVAPDEWGRPTATLVIEGAAR